MNKPKIKTDNLPDIVIQGLAVDIDETLAWTIKHWAEEMQKKFGNPENLSVVELVEKYRYVQNVPYWQSAEALNWQSEKIHSNEHQVELPLIENANHYINKINYLIPIVAYLTTRPETVLAGTKKWLDKHSFPEAPIICRPKNSSHSSGNAWKAKVLAKLYPSVVGIIDDSAIFVSLLSKNYKGVVFLYNHHVTDSKLKVIPCKSWRVVYESVKLYSKTFLKQ